ncbi:MAG: hypothetical protein ACI30W_05890, partial [Muribaculaceae bacterium]
MKKFYTLLAAAAVTMSAAAAPTLAKKALRSFEPTAFDAAKVSALQLQKPAVAEGEYESLEPEVYAYTYYSLAADANYTGMCEFAPIGDDTQSIMARCFLDPQFNLYHGVADAANGTISFPAQFLMQMGDGQGNTYDMWMYAATISADGSSLSLTDDPIVLQANTDGSAVCLNELLVVRAAGKAEIAYD